MHEKKYDLLILGGGPAAQKCAIHAAGFGKKVGLIEKEPKLGGGCVHYGTIPSKSLQETARFYKQIQSQKIHGFSTPPGGKLTLRELMHRTDYVIQKEEEAARLQVQYSGADIITGWGRFIGLNEIEVEHRGNKQIYFADTIVIATGSSPRRPENEGIPFEDGLVYDSDGLYSIDRIPGSIAIVGAGIIGTEYATVFSHVGTEVHLIDNSPVLLPFLDKEISLYMQEVLKAEGLQLHLGEKISTYRKIEGGMEITTHEGSKIKVAQVLISRGRYGNVDNMGLEKIGIDINDRKQIIVDPNYRTNVKHIFAAGDVIGFPALASTSMYQGAHIAKYLYAGADKALNTEELPIGIFTLPEISMIGPTEEELKKRGVDYGVGTANFQTITRSQITGDTQGMLKLLFDKNTRKLLAVHIVADKATELIALGQAVVNLNGPVDYFLDHIFNYPTLIGTYKNAAANGLNPKK